MDYFNYISIIAKLVYNKIAFKDYQKWNIKPFYKAVIYFNNDKSFEDYIQSNSQTDLKAICTFSNYHISSLNKNVLNFLKKIVITVKQQIFLISQKQKYKWNVTQMSFQFNWQEYQILIHIIFLLMKIQDIPRKCYENLKNKITQYYFDFLTQTITVCTSNKQCYHKYIIEQNIFSDISQYLQFCSDSHDGLFQQKNILISQFYDLKNFLISSMIQTQSLSSFLENGVFPHHFQAERQPFLGAPFNNSLQKRIFSWISPRFNFLKIFFQFYVYDYLNLFETKMLDDYLNEQDMQNFYLLVQGNEPECYIEESLNKYSLLQQNIFKLQQINIIIQGQTNQRLQIFTINELLNIKFHFIKGSNNRFFNTLFKLKMAIDIKIGEYYNYNAIQSIQENLYPQLTFNCNHKLLSFIIRYIYCYVY
ncbi:unnamed protein product [Paramecium pentaurelia]|uniref:Uncharacterized protein n=1 Tax=Paramecium pentaurelia TaxID=43138 RepID=A0A8S1U9A9_9CILI|nr:unnamed protein product [Paramecium pentaurelia]